MLHSLKYNGSYSSYANMLNAGPQAPYYPYGHEMAFVTVGTWGR